MHIDRWGITDKGRLRPDNQDSIYFAEADKDGVTQAQIEAHGVLLAVADGVGGEHGGHEASEAIVRHLVRAYYGASRVDPINNLRQAIQQADLLAQREVKYPGAATTLVTAVIWQNRLFIANIGDSRAYWIQGEQIHQLTTDHVQNGKLARYLISYPNVQPDLVELPELLEGDRILLCSDGLYDPIADAAEIRALAAKGSAKQAASRLVNRANQYGGPDNVSVVVAHMGKRPLSLPIPLWQIGLILLVILLFGGLAGLFVNLRGEGENPVELPTEDVPAVVPAALGTPTLAATELASTPTTEDNGAPPGGPAGQATSTPLPTRTATPTITLTPFPSPTFTPGFVITIPVVTVVTSVGSTTVPNTPASTSAPSTNTPFPPATPTLVTDTTPTITATVPTPTREE